MAGWSLKQLYLSFSSTQIGDVLFNIFINDIFHFTNHTKLYNYADDNTIPYSSPHFDTMKQTLCRVSWQVYTERY